MVLPNEILCDVLAYLHREELERLEMVNRRFRDVIRRHFAEWPQSTNRIFQFIVEFGFSNQHVCELLYETKGQQFNKYHKVRGPIERFTSFLRRADITPAHDLKVLINGGVVSDDRAIPPDVRPFTSETERLLLDLRPIWLRSSTSRSIRFATDSSPEDDVKFLKLALRCFDTPAGEAPADYSAIGLDFEDAEKALSLINADAEMIELFAKRCYYFHVTIYPYSARMLRELVDFCRATCTNPIVELRIDDDSGRLSADSTLIRETFESMRPLFPNMTIEMRDTVSEWDDDDMLHCSVSMGERFVRGPQLSGLDNGSVDDDDM